MKKRARRKLLLAEQWLDVGRDLCTDRAKIETSKVLRLLRLVRGQIVKARAA